MSAPSKQRVSIILLLVWFELRRCGVSFWQISFFLVNFPDIVHIFEFSLNDVSTHRWDSFSSDEKRFLLFQPNAILKVK